MRFSCVSRIERSTVVVSCDCRADRGEHLLRPVHDLCVAEAQHSIAQRAQPRITTAIVLEPEVVAVELAPVDFDDQPVADEEVDTHVGDPFLDAASDARLYQQPTEDRLRKRPRTSISCVDDPACVRRKDPAEYLQVTSPDEVQPEPAVEGSQHPLGAE